MENLGSEDGISVNCSKELLRFSSLYINTYAEPIHKIRQAYFVIGYLTSAFAIVAGGALMVKMRRNRTGFVSQLVVGLQVADGFIILACAVTLEWYKQH